MAALLQLCLKLPMLPSALRASSSGAADAEQTGHIHKSQFLQMKCLPIQAVLWALQDEDGTAGHGA